MADNMELFQRLLRVSHTLRHGHGEPELKVAPGQRRVLTTLARNGSKTQRELLKELQISAATLSETLGKLEGKNLIVRTKSTRDRRMTVVSLTDAGAERAHRIMDIDERLADEVFGVLQPDEKSALLDTLDTLLRSWEGARIPVEN